MKQLPQTDVFVLGGGPSGVAAAAAAARDGQKVLLVEKNCFLGGLATAAEVGTICGLYQFRKDKNPIFIAGQFARIFAENLSSKSKTQPMHNASGLHYLPYNIDVFKKHCSALLKKSNVKILLNAELQGIKISQARIKSASLTYKGKLVSYAMKSIIDCSGNSILSQLGHLPLIKSEKYQAAAQVFTLENVGESNETTLGLVLMKELRAGILENKLPDYFDRVYIVPGSLKNGRVSLKIGIPLLVNHTSGNLLELQRVAYLFMNRLTEFLNDTVALFKHAKLLHIAPQIGVRVGMRTLGKYILTDNDVLQCKKFGDGIANAAWPIEEWDQDRRVHMRYFQENDYYQVPARCLQSIAIENLFAAGRCISASDGAIASARVMGICLQTGYAAGRMAAASVRNLSAEDAVRKLQEDEF